MIQFYKKRLLLTALEVSKYFLRKIDKESFELYDNGISNLKMQKLLFFAQQTFFSVYNKPLFKEDMEAWQLGPVVPKVYHHYKIYGRNNIDIFQENLQIDNLDWNIMMILDFVYLKYAKYTAYALVDITHSLPCWINNINKKIPLNAIYSETIKNEFLNFKKELNTISELNIDI